MNDFKLNRLNEPDFKELSEMISEINKFLKEDTELENSKWMKNLETILDFQDTDGSFKLLSSYEIPPEARIDFCHVPTYICTAILMKAYLTGDSTLSQKVEKPLIQGLEMCCLRNLRGHGYEGFKSQIEALNIFIKGGLREFINLYPKLNPKFTKMILGIKAQFAALEAHKDFTDPWGESYKEDILKMNKYFRTKQVFVYGTLMRDEPNHHFLQNSTYIGTATVDRYEMYNVGHFLILSQQNPAITC